MRLAALTSLFIRGAALSSALALVVALSSCGGGGGGGGSSSAVSTTPSVVSTALPSSASVAEQCATPRPAGTIDPLSGSAYGDVQGSLTTEKEWIRSWVNETYLWYADVPTIDPSIYVIGATVPSTDPTTNAESTTTLLTNSDVVNAYFNQERSPFTTASGKPKDQFHFTYVTTDWDALETSGNEAGFGFTAAVIAASPPRSIIVAYTDPGTPAATNSIGRGAQFLTVNGVDVVNGSDIATLNEGLFSPIAGNTYTFVVLDQGSSTPRSVTMMATTVTEVPVQNVGTLPAPNANVGYILFNEHIATAESEFIAAISQLQASNGGAGVSDLVLDLRYNGGGLLDIASEVAYMIGGPVPTTGKIFEEETFNNKNPFNFTASQSTTPFHSTTQGFSTTAGIALPSLALPRVYVITGAGTCSASEAIINSLVGVGVQVYLVGGTTCGKPYGFYPQDNCNTTYFTIQFQGVNNAGFGGYADGFIPAGTGTTANNLPGCMAADDFTKALGDPTEGRLAALLQYRSSNTCPVVIASARHMVHGVPTLADVALVQSPIHTMRILKKPPSR